MISGHGMLPYSDDLVDLWVKQQRHAGMPTWADMPKPWRPDRATWVRWVSEMGMSGALDHYAAVRPDRWPGSLPR